MADSLRIGLAQINPTVGDIAGNLGRIRDARSACGEGCDLMVCSELALIGYPPEDLVLRPAVLAETRHAVDALALDTKSGPAVFVTTPWQENGAGPVYNAAVLLADGRIAAVRYKHELPNYGVFDEKRVFASGPLPEPVDFRGVRLGLMICEDMWYPTVSAHLASRGADMLIVPNGSPFEREKLHQRVELAAARVKETGLALLYVNQVGGQDELVFDGGSFVINPDGTLGVRLAQWKEIVWTGDWKRDANRWTCLSQRIDPVIPEPGNTYHALMLGLRDYVNKNRFPGVLLGLSGGIDSALTAAVAVDALGPDRVRGVRLPSRFTSADSQTDAERSARALRIQLDTIPIGETVEAIERTLAPLFAGHAARRHRGEHPGARPRSAADGGVEQVRRDAPDDREQVRDVGRLRDALRRHVRRLLGAEGSLQDRGLRACGVAQPLPALGRARAGRGSDPAEFNRQGADGGAASQPDGSGLAARIRRTRRDAQRPD